MRGAFPLVTIGPPSSSRQPAGSRPDPALRRRSRRIGPGIEWCVPVAWDGDGLTVPAFAPSADRGAASTLTVGSRWSDPQPPPRRRLPEPGAGIGHEHRVDDHRSARFVEGNRRDPPCIASRPSWRDHLCRNYRRRDRLRSGFAVGEEDMAVDPMANRQRRRPDLAFAADAWARRNGWRPGCSRGPARPATAPRPRRPVATPHDRRSPLAETSAGKWSTRTASSGRRTSADPVRPALFTHAVQGDGRHSVLTAQRPRPELRNRCSAPDTRHRAGPRQPLPDAMTPLRKSSESRQRASSDSGGSMERHPVVGKSGGAGRQAPGIFQNTGRGCLFQPCKVCRKPQFGQANCPKSRISLPRRTFQELR